MSAQVTAAFPRSNQMGGSQGQASPYVHPAAVIQGDVQLQANVQIAPGACLTAEAGAVLKLGADTLVQQGAVLHGSSPGQVLGDDRTPCSIWIGAAASITYKTVINGPAYVGEGSFIGFRSTLFNVRVGHSCIVMMHTLLQDVEIPSGKLVPSGSIITRQDQADQLPDAGPSDWAIVAELLGDSRAPSYLSTAARMSAPDLQRSASAMQSNERDGFSIMQSEQLTPEIVQLVRQYLGQGLRIATEHADARRFRSNVWQSCGPIQSTREADVLAALATCLQEHAGEYVRLFGIDPVAKSRVSPVTIQRPDGPVHVSAPAVSISAKPASGNRAHGGPAVGSLNADIVQQVRSYLAQGFKIGTEHADLRRYRSNVWQTCSPISSTRESDVMSALEGCLAEHSGEYVRMFGIDPVAKRRIAPVTIQHPNGQTSASLSSGNRSSQGSVAAPAANGSAQAAGDVAQQVRQWLQMGFQIGAEHADARRYRSNVWQTCPPITGRRDSEVMAAINSCLAEHSGEYVRIFGIDPVAKRRVAPVTIQRPGTSAGVPSTASGSSAKSSQSTPVASQGNGASQNGSGAGQPLPADLVQQVNQLINQGYRVSLEHADGRRYRSGAWQTSAALEGVRTSDILSALESRLRQHRGEYVRLVGIDPKAKRRVLETTIQRP